MASIERPAYPRSRRAVSDRELHESFFYTRSKLGAPHTCRLELPQQAPRALDTKNSTRWRRTVERWLNPRDRVLALLPFYAGLRLGEVVALNLSDVQLSARKGLIIVRSGKGNRYREIPAHPVLRQGCVKVT